MKLTTVLLTVSLFVLSSFSEKKQNNFSSFNLNKELSSTDQKLGTTKEIYLKSDLGTYLSLCRNCQQTVNELPLTATLHSTNKDGNSKLTMTQMPNGNYTFKNYEGNYMSLCQGCIVNAMYNDFVTFHESDPNQPWTQFEMIKLPTGKFAFKNVHNGKFLTRCNSCSPTSTYADVVTIHAGNAEAVYAQWTIE